MSASLQDKIRSIPHVPGVYMMRDATGGILYIGKARDLKKRVASYLTRASLPDKVAALIACTKHVDYVPTASEKEALIVERRLIRRFKPHYNIMWRDDKSYPYLKLTVNEDFPRLFFTRKRKRDRAKYFGPFPLVSQIRNLLRWTWKRKFFPLRPCKIDFSEKSLPPLKKVESCLYLHTGACPAPCIGKISKKGYRKIVRRTELFLKGRHEKLTREWEKEMHRSAKRLAFESAAQLRDNIRAVEHMKERVSLRSLREEEIIGKVSLSRSISDLQIVLQLPRPPLVIEAFDISHTFGQGIVASMVRFNRGEADRSSYRRFRIRSIQKQDDFAAMKEVVERRYRGILSRDGKLPDLVLIDGGKGQLSAACSALAQLGIRNLSLAALAKYEEELFLPGRSKSIRLPHDAPALHLVQRVRDESHRFAVSYHRLLRKKELFGSSPKK